MMLKSILKRSATMSPASRLRHRLNALMLARHFGKGVREKEEGGGAEKERREEEGREKKRGEKKEEEGDNGRQGEVG